MAYLYILGTILFTVYGQLIIKWKISKLEFNLPDGISLKILALFKLIFDPFIFSGFFAAFIASFFWMAAISKLDLSHAYPFMGLSFVLVTGLSIFIFNENFNLGKLIGVSFIVIGIIISSRSL